MPMNKNNGCCHDDVKIIKMQDDQNNVIITYALHGIEPAAVIRSGFITTPILNENETPHYYTHSPPLLTSQDTYLQNCVFRI